VQLMRAATSFTERLLQCALAREHGVARVSPLRGVSSDSHGVSSCKLIVAAILRSAA